MQRIGKTISGEDAESNVWWLPPQEGKLLNNERSVPNQLHNNAYPEYLSALEEAIASKDRDAHPRKKAILKSLGNRLTCH